MFCPHLDRAMGILNDGVDCVGTGSDDNGDNDGVFGDLVDDNGDPVNGNGDNDDVFGDLVYQARALRALGLLLADGTPTVGGGKTF